MTEPVGPPGPGLIQVSGRLAELWQGGARIVALTGSVASGKSTLAAQLEALLQPVCATQTLSTDGFLLSNAQLTQRGLLDRKGFPDTYDRAGMARALAELRRGRAFFPGYSHTIYDIDPALGRWVESPDLLILEGLGHLPLSPAAQRRDDEPDLLIYVDAALEDLETWYVARFERLWEAAAQDPTSFYARFRHMDVVALRDFARQVWTTVNLPNLTAHIAPLRAGADLVVRKQADHSLALVADRTA